MIELTMEAWSRIFFSISALAYTVLVLIVFLKKEKVWTLDNHVYLAMLILVIAQLSLGCFNQAVIDPQLSLITKKIYNSLFCIWGSMTTLYFFVALSNRSQGYVAYKNYEAAQMFKKDLDYIDWIYKYEDGEYRFYPPTKDNENKDSSENNIQSENLINTNDANSNINDLLKPDIFLNKITNENSHNNILKKK